MTQTKAHDGSGSKHDSHDLAEGFDTLKTDVKNLARGAVETAKEKIEGAKDMAREKYEGAKEAAVDAAHSLKDVIATHPVASMSIAAGIGILIGMVLFRPRS